MEKSMLSPHHLIVKGQINIVPIHLKMTLAIVNLGQELPARSSEKISSIFRAESFQLPLKLRVTTTKMEKAQILSMKFTSQKTG
jgi:hypothetical protein